MPSWYYRVAIQTGFFVIFSTTGLVLSTAAWMIAAIASCSSTLSSTLIAIGMVGTFLSIAGIIHYSDLMVDEPGYRISIKETTPNVFEYTAYFNDTQIATSPRPTYRGDQYKKAARVCRDHHRAKARARQELEHKEKIKTHIIKEEVISMERKIKK